MAKSDESKDTRAGAPQRYNPHTAQWEPETDPYRIAEHEAQRAGKPAPGDRTEEELRALDGGAGAPVLTSNANLGATDPGPTGPTGPNGGGAGATGATGSTGETS